MRNILLLASLLLLAGCQKQPEPPKVAKIPVQVAPAPVAKPKAPVIENSVLLPPPVVENELVVIEPEPEPIIEVTPEPEPEVVIVAPEPEPVVVAIVEKVCDCVDCGCKQGKACKCCGDVCKCVDCKCAEDVPPQKPEPVVAQAPPPVKYTVPPVPAGHTRTYFWQNGKRWYRDVPNQQYGASGAACASCSPASSTTYGKNPGRKILPWRR